MTAHDDLRRQLTDSVEALATAPGARRPHRSRRRWRGSHRGLAIVVLALAGGSGVAGAATQLFSAREPGDGAKARMLASRAMADASADDACKRAAGTFVGGSAFPAIEEIFPPRTAPIPPAVRKAILRNTGGAVISSSVRLVHLPGAHRLLVYATQGSGLFAPADPDACDRQRRTRVMDRHPKDDAVRRLALAIVANARGGQTLLILALGRNGFLGTGVPMTPGRPVPTGVLFGGGPTAATLQAGIAVAGARTVTLTTKPGAKRPLRRTIDVRERLFAFTLPRGTGPVTLRQRAADGTVLAMQRIRG